MCKFLAQEFEQRAAIAHRWDDMLRESHVLQLVIDLPEPQSRACY